MPTPPEARIRNWLLAVSVKGVEQPWESAQTKEPVFVAFASVPAANELSPLATLQFPPGMVELIPLAVLEEPPPTTVALAPLAVLKEPPPT